MEEVEDSPDFWSGPVQSYNSPVEHRFLIGLDRSINGLLPDCDHKYVSVRTMPPGCPLVHQKLLTLSSQLPSRSLHRCWRVIVQSVTTSDLLARLSWDGRDTCLFILTVFTMHGQCGRYR